MTEATAIMIFGYSSSEDSVLEEFFKLAKYIRERLPKYDVESGFLGYTNPVISVGLEKLIERGAKKIICVPGMLFVAKHENKDLQSEINNFTSLYPGIEFICTRELAIDPKLLIATRDRIEECESSAPSSIDRKETLLMVVGHGTNDADANSNIHKVTRMLWEGMGFGWAEASYASGTYPLGDDGIRHAMKLGYKRVIIFPYFLFTDTSVSRIYVWADEAQVANPDVEVLNAPHLNDHMQLLDCFVDRIEEALVGSNAMNCLLCKYREQIVGYKGSVNSDHEVHHHHALDTKADIDSALDHPHKD